MFRKKLRKKNPSDHAGAENMKLRIIVGPDPFGPRTLAGTNVP